MKAGDQGCTSVSARATKGVYMVAKDSPGRWVCVHDRFEGYEAVLQGLKGLKYCG